MYKLFLKIPYILRCIFGTFVDVTLGKKGGAALKAWRGKRNVGKFPTQNLITATYCLIDSKEFNF
jgi:hypothetical protein